MSDQQYDSAAKTAEQAVIFANRLEKQYKHLKKWARRTGVTCYRLYDKDIPEVPLACDLYQNASNDELSLHVSLYERPYDKPEAEEIVWMNEMKKAAAEVLSIPESRIYTKIRKRQRGEDSQYERMDSSASRMIVMEGGSRFIVNLTDYLDTGLFLDHRPARMLVRGESEGKRVLNLFSYTGAFSVHAAAGGAASVTSVDLSKTYLTWAAENLTLNGFRTHSPRAGRAPRSPERPDTEPSFGSAEGIAGANNRYPCVHADVKAFLASSRREGLRWDLIVCDPPTFSNSKRAADILDLNRDWAEMCRSCLAVLAPGGILYFSTNSRSLKFDPEAIGGAASRPDTKIQDLSAASIPEDFRNKNIHRLWKITLP